MHKAILFRGMDVWRGKKKRGFLRRGLTRKPHERREKEEEEERERPKQTQAQKEEDRHKNTFTGCFARLCKNSR